MGFSALSLVESAKEILRISFFDGNERPVKHLQCFWRLLQDVAQAREILACEERLQS